MVPCETASSRPWAMRFTSLITRFSAPAFSMVASGICGTRERSMIIGCTISQTNISISAGITEVSATLAP